MVAPNVVGTLQGFGFWGVGLHYYSTYHPPISSSAQGSAGVHTSMPSFHFPNARVRVYVVPLFILRLHMLALPVCRLRVMQFLQLPLMDAILTALYGCNPLSPVMEATLTIMAWICLSGSQEHPSTRTLHTLSTSQLWYRFFLSS
eukprot:428658-Rhodomonas_salina.1